MEESFDRDDVPGTSSRRSVESRIRLQVKQLKREGKIPSSPPPPLRGKYCMIGRRREWPTWEPEYSEDLEDW